MPVSRLTGVRQLARAAQTLSRTSNSAATCEAGCAVTRRTFAVEATRNSGSATTATSAKLDANYADLANRGASGDWRFYGIAGAALAGAAAVYFGKLGSSDEEPAGPNTGVVAADASAAQEEHDEHHLVNWSGTHEVRPKRFYQPETVEEVERIVADAHKKGEKLRAMGSALSPNALAFSPEGMLSLALLDKIVEIDSKKGTITVEAGARVQQVVEALRDHNLTLQNFASIREQAIGGFVQVSAHGTGATIPPVDEQVVAMTLVAPGQGTLYLSEDHNPELFRLARVGLGSLGVVTELTLQCVPAHQLEEHTFVLTPQQIVQQHTKLLKRNKHLRYMWIPFTDSVVVVTNNPISKGWWQRVFGGSGNPAPSTNTQSDDNQRLQALRQLLLEAKPQFDRQELQHLTATQLRDQLLLCDPLNRKWVARVNQAEAEFWKRSQGTRVGWSDELLGFDCGGQQWVLETCFPTGTLKKPNGADLAYMRDLLTAIESCGIPAPAPIEQRWTASSRSPMSPAAAPPGQPDTVFSWVGIIMYLPTEDPATRKAITDSFRQYVKVCEEELMPMYDAVDHWAKTEPLYLVPEDLEQIRRRVAKRFPVERFNAARRKLDPKNILSNDLIDALFPL